MLDPPRSHRHPAIVGGFRTLRALLLFAALCASVPALAWPARATERAGGLPSSDVPTHGEAPSPADEAPRQESRAIVPPADAPRAQLRAYKREATSPSSARKGFESALQPAPDAAIAEGSASVLEAPRPRTFALLFGASAGVGLPTQQADLRSDTQRVVSGFSGGPPSIWVAGTIPLNAKWEIMLRFGGQFVWAPDDLSFTPSVELRARAFPGVSSGPWDAFFTMGVGYGWHHHMVQADETAGEEPVRVRALQKADSGPVRILGGMGARWNSRGRFMVEVDVLPYVFVPKWSFHLEFALSVGVKL